MIYRVLMQIFLSFTCNSFQIVMMIIPLIFFYTQENSRILIKLADINDNDNINENEASKNQMILLPL